MKKGVMGGTFDPVHRGHLAIAEEAYHFLNLNQVIFVPAGHPYFKNLLEISPVEDRVQMLRLAIQDVPYFKLSLIEVQREGPSYTVDTLALLREQSGDRDELYFIMGWDSLQALPKWKDPDKILDLCTIVAAPRPGFPKPDLRELERELPGIARKTVFLEKPMLDISSTQIRERVKAGQPIENLVPAEVAKYIREKGLYLVK